MGYLQEVDRWLDEIIEQVADDEHASTQKQKS
jgi:hypothetical protein